MVPRDLGKAVEILVELPGQAGLADAGDAHDRDQVGLPVVGAREEQLLDGPQLAIAPDERRLQPLGLQGSARSGDHPNRAPERDGFDLALELVGSGIFVHDDRVGGPLRGLPHEHGPRLGDRLDARRRVHKIARDHPLSLGPDRHRGLPRQHPGPGGERCPYVDTEVGDGFEQVERGSDRSFGIVLLGGRCTPYGHHRIADEFLQGPAVEGDQAPTGVEVPGEELADLLRVPALRKRGEPDQIGEQHRDESPLGGRGRGRLGRPGRLGRRPGPSAVQP